mgnify:CR=1 FL=1
MIKLVLLLLFALNLALANLTDEGQTAYDAGDEQKAAKIWLKACKAGEARGCVRLGFLYQSGKGVEQDDVKAAKFYEKACDAGELAGCDSLASLYQNSGEYAKVRPKDGDARINSQEVLEEYVSGIYKATKKDTDKGKSEQMVAKLLKES